MVNRILMKSGGVIRHLLLAFFIALIVYTLFFSLDQHLRTRRGPWIISFTSEPGGEPAILIRQEHLNISNVKILFPGQTNNLSSKSIAYAEPWNQPPPFGNIVFFDTTYLPGTLTLDLFGHEIELLPRTLVIDRKEHPWRSHETIRLGR